MYRIISVTDAPGYKERAVDWFSSKWGIPREEYEKSLNDCLTADKLPRWYLALDQRDEIAGGCGLIQNDFVDRTDLFPYLCALFVEPWARGCALGGMLLDNARREAGRLGYRNVYLCTDHDSYYERYGWSYMTQGHHPGGDTSRIYTAPAIFERRIIDLTHPMTAETPVYPGDSPIRLEHTRTLERDAYNAFKLTAGLHVGTHMDMPMHLTADDRFCGDFPLDRFIVPGVVLDARDEPVAAMKPQYEATVREGCAVLVYTGWDRLFGRSEKYFSEHPVLSAELTDFLIDRRIAMLGLDTPSPDRLPYTQHKKLLSAGIFVLENLTGLSVLPGSGFTLHAAPLKLAAEGSPVRAYALLEGC